MRPGRIVIAETYPAEFYRHLGLVWSPRVPGRTSGKRAQADRARNAVPLLAWATSTGVILDSALAVLIRDGFGPAKDGEDPFDAAVGLFGMLNVVLGRHPAGDPGDEETRRIEGWILGQRPW